MNYIRHGIGRVALAKAESSRTRFLKGLIDDHFQVLCQRVLRPSFELSGKRSFEAIFVQATFRGTTPQWWDIKRRSNIAWWKIFRTPASDTTCIRFGGGDYRSEGNVLTQGEGRLAEGDAVGYQLRPGVSRSMQLSQQWERPGESLPGYRPSRSDRSVRAGNPVSCGLQALTWADLEGQGAAARPQRYSKLLIEKACIVPSRRTNCVGTSALDGLCL